jgi:hypothetical protein
MKKWEKAALRKIEAVSRKVSRQNHIHILENPYLVEVVHASFMLSANIQHAVQGCARTLS